MDITALSITAASIGFFHTLFGPDHYVPFIIMSKANNWTYKKTIIVTILCGIGHVLSSVIIGIFGILLGSAVGKLKILESFRGEIAAWALITFGLLYAIWGIKKIRTKNTHSHHTKTALHHKKNITPWVLFTIFVLGPCEPLIPLLMFPAIKESTWSLLSVTAIFSIVTVATMTTVVMLSIAGFDKIPFKRMERFTHVFAGLAICLCGVSIKFLGL